MQPPSDEVTTAMHRITIDQQQPIRPSAATRAMRPVPRGLAATLLPGESVTFGSTPHPFVLARPLLLALAVMIAFGVAWQTLPFKDHVYVGAAGAIAALASLVAFARGAGYFLGFRAVATNRRIFVIRGIVWRRVAPLGNGALASSTLVQGIFGRMFGFGSIDVPQTGTKQTLFRDMRDAAELYRECQAVANGVDGDVWTPAVRQTIIP
jgi:hypothetical protein